MPSQQDTRSVNITVHVNNTRMAIPIDMSTWCLTTRLTREIVDSSTSTITTQIYFDRDPEKAQLNTLPRTETSSPTPDLPTTPELKEIHGLPLSPPPLPRRSSSKEYEPATHETGSYNGIVSSPTLGKSTLYGSPIPPSGLPSTMRPSYFTLGDPSISIDRDPNDPKRSIWSVHPGAEKHHGQGL